MKPVRIDSCVLDTVRSTAVLSFQWQATMLMQLLCVLLLFVVQCESWIGSLIPSKRNQSVELIIANLPKDLGDIRACRRTAFPPGKRLLQSEASFVTATALVDGKQDIICIIAKQSSLSSSRQLSRRVVGTAEILPSNSNRFRNNRGGGGTPKTATIRNVLVQPDLRGQGIGRMLMLHCEAIAAKNKLETLELTVATQNRAALLLYQDLGYQAQGVHALTLWLGSITPAALTAQLTKKIVDV
jgi:GNAT superfamily N-acetyltransferase